MAKVVSFAHRWPLPGRDPLPLAEVAVAIRLYETAPALCLVGADQLLPAPTLAAWLAWCEECWRDFGLVPSGV